MLVYQLLSRFEKYFIDLRKLSLREVNLSKVTKLFMLCGYPYFYDSKAQALCPSSRLLQKCVYTIISLACNSMLPGGGERWGN